MTIAQRLQKLEYAFPRKMLPWGFRPAGISARQSFEDASFLGEAGLRSKPAGQPQRGAGVKAVIPERRVTLVWALTTEGPHPYELNEGARQTEMNNLKVGCGFFQAFL